MTAVLSYKTKQAIDAWLTKYPTEQRQSAVIFALKVVQEENGGWLNEESMDMVAAYLNMPRIAVYEVATFYNMFELSPVGKYKICVCTNISCMLKGADEVLTHLKEKLKIDFGQTTTDGRFTLKEVECLAACGGAPVLQIGRTYYENLTPEKIDAILSELEEG
jgi:NADH-quinone oxidoreductase subunit E